MHIQDIEFKLTSDAVLKQYGEFGTLSFHCAAKDIDRDHFNPVILISCTLRTTAKDAQQLHETLIKGKRVKLSGVYENPAFENGGDQMQYLAVDQLTFSRKNPAVEQEVASALVA